MMDSAALIDTYFPGLTARQKEQFKLLGPLYSDWNEKINVISRKDMDHFYERHVLHSLAIAKISTFSPGTRLLDVGTGGGFPGIPLAILFPECHFHLVDSIGKKIRVVENIKSELRLENVTAETIRAEQLKTSYDFILSRAVTRMKPFLQWVARKVSSEQNNELKNGILYLKGGSLEEEMKEIKRKHTIYEISDLFTEDFFETKKIVHVPLTPRG